MEIDIGARIITRDGETAGRLSKVVVDPVTHDLQALVVTTGGRVARDLVVPLDLVESARRDVIVLRIAAWELAEMPKLIAEAFVRPSDHEPMLGRFQPEAVLLPIRSPSPAGAPPPMVAVPPTSAVIREGMVVLCVDGPCGTVDEVKTDLYRGVVTGFVIRKGAIFPRDVTVPVHLVNEIADQHLRVAATKDELEHLLPLPPADYVPTEGPAAERPPGEGEG